MASFYKYTEKETQIACACKEKFGVPRNKRM